MKRILALLLSFFFCATALLAQEQQVKVTLKNGTTMVGELVSIDPVGSIEIKISGVECKVLMTEVVNVEPVEDKTTTVSNASKETMHSNLYGEYLVTDMADYPDSIVVSICDKKFTLILVRGGMFNMGYDGNGSLSMDSEPVHRVELSSFYVSKNLVTNDVAYNFIKGDPDRNIFIKGEANENIKKYRFVTRNWDKAKQVVDGIAKQEGVPFRLLTEAEWEYSAIQPISELIFENVINSKPFFQGNYIGEWCNDFKDDYPPSKQINPQGPKCGRKHIVRAFSYDYKKWSRNTKHFRVYYNERDDGYYVRFAISADSIDKIK